MPKPITNITTPCCNGNESSGVCDSICANSILSRFYQAHLANDLSQLKEGQKKISAGQIANTKTLMEHSGQLEDHQRQLDEQREETKGLKGALQQHILKCESESEANKVHTQK